MIFENGYNKEELINKKMNRQKLKSKEYLRKILWKVENGKTDFNKEEKDCLREVFEEIQGWLGKTRTLDLTCSNCVLSAIGIVKNYLNHHGGYDELKSEENEDEIKAKVTIITLDSNQESKSQEQKEADSIELKGLQLKELRKLYPHIKSKTIDGFLKKIEDEKETTSNKNI